MSLPCAVGSSSGMVSDILTTSPCITLSVGPGTCWPNDIAWYVLPPMMGSSMLSPVRLNSTTLRPVASRTSQSVSANAFGMTSCSPPMSCIFSRRSVLCFVTPADAESAAGACVKVLPSSVAPMTATAAIVRTM